MVRSISGMTTWVMTRAVSRAEDWPICAMVCWLACFELVARRCRLAPDRQPRYTLDELRELVGGVGGEHIRASLRRLENARLAVFNEHSISLMPDMEPAERGRPVPVARKIIRLLAGSRGRAFAVDPRKLAELAERPTVEPAGVGLPGGQLDASGRRHGRQLLRVAPEQFRPLSAVEAVLPEVRQRGERLIRRPPEEFIMGSRQNLFHRCFLS
jgi:hypothetical protein